MTTTVGTELRVREVPVAEYTLHVNEIGDPGLPTVLWLHGSGPGVSALSNWERLIATMPGQHHIAPDILGFGASTHPDPAPVGIKAYTQLRAEVMIGLLDALGLDRVHIVGNSMGGMIAITAVLAAPERFDRLVLMGSGGSPVAPTRELIQMVTYYQNESPEAMKALLQNFVHDNVTFGGRLDEIAEDRYEKAHRPEVRRSHLATFDMTGGPVQFDAETLGGVQQQALVLHGREDRLIPVEAGLYLSTHLPNAQLHIFPHAGHWAQIEQAERFRAVVELFLFEDLGVVPSDRSPVATSHSSAG